MIEREEDARSSWKHRPEGGSRGSLALIVAIARHGGRWLARLCLYPITLYFLVMRGPERRASRAWLSQVRGRRAGVWAAARHIHTFAATILDRVYLIGGSADRFDIRVHGLSPLHALVDAGRGALLFGSHLGSFDALRVLARQRPGLTVRVVLDRAHNPVLTEIFESLDPSLAAGVIDGGQPGAAIALEIRDALEAGSLVALLVDRALPHEATAAVPFLGRPARFPLTPWGLAAALRAPVLLCFGLYRGGKRYDLHFEPFCDPAVEGGPPARGARAQWMRDRVAGYAARLEHHARQAPCNWFNFYDFWNDDGQDPMAAPPHDRTAAGMRAGAAVRRG
ncbi:acyltransferase [Pseudoxanthomonas broegbernensis]|uniref:Acyltransferase n=1 Tax=Pseudoxanthomonas broegbernensis TaxID=83619 RepID=A0A7V8K6W0_9GAMM|nr:acyltransferase [Pseudoxanthomonas broegbernensis]KAF1685716.1 acyltransferase [Pseudoxanthomonas broegbernensis]MBB6066065.1 putative LPLAT superfamily acyltransferase [Pseudoxanthomonas broegbernensis]